MQYLNRNLFPALLLAVFLFGTLKVKSADPIDSLTIRIEQAGEDTNKVNLLRALAIHHLTVTGEYDQAILYYNKMIELSKNIDYPYGVARAYKGIGNTYLVQGDFYLAVDNYYEAWGIARENNLRRTESTLINNIGLLYYRLGDYTNALEYYFKSLGISMNVENNGVTGMTYVNLGDLYKDLKNYEKSLDYYEKGLVILQINNYPIRVAKAYFGLGELYLAKGEAGTSLEYFKKCLEVRLKAGHKKAIGASYTSLGNVYQEIGDYPLAMEYYLRSLRIREDLGDKYGRTDSYVQIGNLLMINHKIDSALLFLNKGLRLAQDVGLMLQEKQAFEKLALLYEQEGDYKKAHEYQKLFMSVRDSLFDQIKGMEIGTINSRYEFVLRQLEFERDQEEADAIARQEKKRKDLLQYSGSFIFIILLVLALVFSTRLKIPLSWADGLVFFTFLLIFEFTLVLTDPFIEGWTGGEPAYKLIINAAFAGVIIPVHRLIEHRIKSRLSKVNS